MVDKATPQRIEGIDITNEMSSSFLDYAMSVIVSRALPDVRDGLKPVQRRIIYAMHEAGINPGSPTRKSSKVVGDVMGNYHPHGDTAIYDALVRMGQDFSLRQPLIDPQGNFGSVDHPPGAMRYTECRLTALATKLLEGIKEETVDFELNYSGEIEEPTVLPSRFPSLLANGSSGIAVGMATNIPPHNLGEVIDAITFAVDNPDATPEQFMEFVKGPDFPTGGYIVGKDGIRDALMTGRGSIKMRAVTDVQEVGRGRSAIIVTELPYQVSHNRVLEKIANLVQNKRVTGISDLRNESSDRVGTRLVIELKRDSVPQVVLNQLFKMTQLQDTFGVNTVALVEGAPRTLNIAQLIGYYTDHQMEVVERRTAFRLDKAKQRAHIVEGLLIALDRIDEVVSIIRGSEDTESARSALTDRFDLSQTQAQHILDMPLRRLTALETSKLRGEYEELERTIKSLEAILKSPAKRRKLIKEELAVIREEFADRRRTRIVPDEGDLSLEDLIADEELIITVSANGYLKSVTTATYRTQGRGGRGVKAAEMREDDVVEHILHTTAHAYLLFFTNRGQVHRVRAHEIPRQERTAKGVLSQSVLPLEPEERIQAIVDTRDYETARFLVTVTKKGQVKKTAMRDYDSRQASLVAIRLQENDEVVEVHTTSGENELLLFTRNGLGIRFSEGDLRPMGRATQGVRGIRLREGDEVIGATSDIRGDQVLLITSGGYGKRVLHNYFPKQKRGGIGVKAIKLTRVRGQLVGVASVASGSEIFVISSTGIAIRTGVDQISRQKREATGVRVMDLPKGSQVAGFALVPADDQT